MKNLLSNDTKISFLRIFSGSNLKSTGLLKVFEESALLEHTIASVHFYVVCVVVLLCCVLTSAYLFSGYDSSFMSSIQKLFTERIEVFSSVDFSKISIVTGVIEITLKVTNNLSGLTVQLECFNSSVLNY